MTTLLDQVFSQLFQVVPYVFFQGVMAVVIIVEFFYTIVVEPLDRL